MILYPESTLQSIEFDQIRLLVQSFCKTDFAKNKAENLRIHTRKDYVVRDLSQTAEFKSILDSGLYFPNDFFLPLKKELKLLGIPGAMLSGEEFRLIRSLSDNAERIFRWFDADRRIAYPSLSMPLDGLYFEKNIRKLIDEIIDEAGQVKDQASKELMDIRTSLYRKRNEHRRAFDRVISRLNKLGYLAEIEESFMNGRRVLAVFAENKRMIKGMLHGESDSRRTSFIEPEETMGLNNEIYSLELDETREVQRILRALTQQLSAYAPLLSGYVQMSGVFDFIRAKARFAQEIDGNAPLIHDKAIIKLIKAHHPLLYLHNKKLQKPTIPVSLTLDDKHRILVISGPNAGGKTVTMKTLGLLQLMAQAGLLIPASPDSELGIFKQMFIHIGDTQSIEFELSTYSAHLTHMKYFIETANGKTLFFIDELGSGSDPQLGGAFAEVILEELSRKHAIGIVTTHYLNLKVMANEVNGIFNGAMLFDEKNLLPLYQLKVGAPGSSYTFSIAERIGLDKRLIQRAKKLVDQGHVRLDQLLNSTEQDMQQLENEKRRLDKLLKENERLKHHLEVSLDKEKHRQEMERIKLQNKISEEKLNELKETERKLKSLVVEWRKSENKDAVLKLIHQTLMGQKKQIQADRQREKVIAQFEETGQLIEVGSLVKMKKNRQVGQVKEIRGKKALLQVGVIPMLVSLEDLVVVKDKKTS
jgi:DNA mismatch repair protein MutS2